MRSLTKHSSKNWILLAVCTIFIISACQKQIDKPATQQQSEEVGAANNNQHGHLQQTKSYSSEVVLKWMDIQYRIFLQLQEQSAGVRIIVSRFYGYCGIALYESVMPGMPSYQSLSGQLSDMPSMPEVKPGIAYHWPTCANAVLAYMTKNLLPLTSAVNKNAMDSLENALNNSFAAEINESTFQRSVEFGKTVAQTIFNWSKTDGLLTILTSYPPYVLPVGPGLWQPTPPDFQPLQKGLPYYGEIRPFMPGVLNETAPPAPTPYSTNNSSEFFNNMKEVYDASQTLTTAQRAQALYWRGTTGGTNVAHWYAILKKILIEQENAAMLDTAVLAYCTMGIAANDAAISKFKTMFVYNQLRPITYIRNVMGDSTWNSLFANNVIPAYPEAHTPEHAACAAAMSLMFGNNYSFSTDGTHHLGLPGYNFNSFDEALTHATLSRFYAGVAAKPSIDAGIWIGKKTAEYMKNKIKFLKE